MTAPDESPTVFDVEYVAKRWIDLRRRYAMSMRLSIDGALRELHKDYQRWRDLSHDDCLARYRSPRVKSTVSDIMTIVDILNY